MRRARGQRDARDGDGAAQRPHRRQGGARRPGEAASELSLTTPRRGMLVVRIRAFGPGGGALRVVTLKARP